jgi:flagellar biosynthesis protein FliP
VLPDAATNERGVTMGNASYTCRERPLWRSETRQERPPRAPRNAAEGLRYSARIVCAIVLSACAGLFQARALAGPDNGQVAVAGDLAANALLPTVVNSASPAKTSAPATPARNMESNVRANPAPTSADINAASVPQANSYASPSPEISFLPEALRGGPKAWTSPEGLRSTLEVMLLLTVVSLVPAALLMTTCFVRIIVVLSLLKQALGAQQLPPTQVVTALALFLTLLIMTPVWKQVYDDAVAPYTEHKITLEQACSRGVAPVRRFMSMQIERTRNSDDVWLFMNYLPNHPKATSYDDVPLQALLPAFLLSELKTAFLIGFQIYLPFLIIDMVVASVMVSMGMMMVPPVLVSLPFKLLLFVLVDGWRLVVGMLLESFQPFT